MTRYVRALEAKYQAKVEEALATIDLYLTKTSSAISRNVCLSIDISISGFLNKFNV